MNREREDKEQSSLTHSSMWGEPITWGPWRNASGILTRCTDMVVCVRQSYQGGMDEACSTHNTCMQHNGRMTCRENHLEYLRTEGKVLKW